MIGGVVKKNPPRKDNYPSDWSENDIIVMNCYYRTRLQLLKELKKNHNRKVGFTEEEAVYYRENFFKKLKFNA